MKMSKVTGKDEAELAAIEELADDYYGCPEDDEPRHEMNEAITKDEIDRLLDPYRVHPSNRSRTRSASKSSGSAGTRRSTAGTLSSKSGSGSRSPRSSQRKRS